MGGLCQAVDRGQCKHSSTVLQYCRSKLFSAKTEGNGSALWVIPNPVINQK